MKQTKKHLFLPFFLLLLTGLACQIGGSLPSTDEVADTATKAAAAASTAAAVGGQAVDAAATLAASEQATIAAQAVATGVASAGDAAATIAAGGVDLSDLDALKEKFAAVVPDENGNITITVTDDEMNQAIAAKQAQSGGDAVLQGTQVSFSDGNIVLTGSVIGTGALLTAVFHPTVVNGVLQLEILSATIGELTVPPAVLTAAQTTLNTTLSEAIGALPATFTLQTIIVNEGTMTITASR